MKTFELQKSIQHPVLITDPKMIHYFTGESFHVAERFIGLLVSPHFVHLFLNDLFPTQFSSGELVRFNDAQDAIKVLAPYLKTDKLYVDRQMQAGFLLRLMKDLPLLAIEIDQQADRVRAIKNADEIEKMRKASHLNDLAMREVKKLMIPGVTESQVASQIESIFMSLGADALSFAPIVAFGDNTADPHATPGNRVLKEVDSIIVDMGCKKDGYCSDMTRSFLVGDSPMKKIYEVVLKANLAAIQAVKPGVPFKHIDQAARDVITQAGYGDYFIHRTGHGIGQDVHEPYDVSSVNETLTQVGMIFSIEPGIYIPGLGGIRIEDLVCVTLDGVEVLNQDSKTQAQR